MADVAASVRARLLQRAKERREEFELTLARFAAERILYRLGRSAASERCLLKGGALLSVWLADPYRSTRDVDLLAFGPADDAAVRDLVTEICAVACSEDGLVFDLSELAISPIRIDEQYPGRRARFRAHLGSARIAVQLDIAIGDAVAVKPELITYPVLLPNLPAPRLLAYPREVSLAEKFHAMVALETDNSRMKDFHDVWALSDAFAFDGATLRRAAEACFERRGLAWVAEAPRVLTPDFYALPALSTRWRNYLASGAVLVPPPSSFTAIGERIVEFLGPVRESIVGRRPFQRVWKARGPWG